MSSDVGTQRGLYEFILKTDTYRHHRCCLCGYSCYDEGVSYWKYSPSHVEGCNRLYNHIYNLEPGDRDRHTLMAVGEMF